MENRFRGDFPIFENSGVHYLDSAATTQRPRAVIAAINEFYEKMNANPLRGLYSLSMSATDAYEEARERVAKFIGAKNSREIIFTRNTSESLNLVSYSYALNNLKEGDEIVSTVMEHHSNMLPWQFAARKTGAVLKYLEPDREGRFSDEEINSKITDKTKLVAIGHVSNVLGCTNPVREIADVAHSKGAVVVVDAAQSAPHMRVDVKDLGADFLAFSGHKLMAPFGIGVLYGREELLEGMEPFNYGGEMIETVKLEGATYAELPHKFEAGTVNAAGAYALMKAIDYLENVGFDFIKETEERLTGLVFEEFAKLPYAHILGSPRPEEHCGIISFTIDGVHPHDISSILDGDNVAIRAGHHCAEPLHVFLGIPSTARASIYLYNTQEDIRAFIDSIKNVRGILGYGS